MMIEVDKLTKYFGPVQAVDRVSFQVDQGEIVGFLGPNGAGKTTTMRILTTYLPATSGVAKVAGYDVMTQSLDVRRNIGYLPESVPLYPEMRVEEYLQYRAKLKGVPRQQRVSRIDYCLDRCRLREVRRRLLGTLSRGYRQRVGLADAMIHDPPILILDEPTAGLDPIQIRETLAFIKELGENHTILLSTHILTEVEAICERAIIIDRGRIRQISEVDVRPVLLLEVRAPLDNVTGLLRGLAGITEIVTRPLADGLNGFEVRTADDQDLREQVGKAIHEKGWIVRRLERSRPKLEEAFFDVVSKEDPLKEGVKAGASENIKK